MTARGPSRLLGVLPLVLGLTLWQVMGTSASPYAPKPSTWWRAVERLDESDLLVPALRATFETFLLSLAVAVAVGSLVGLAIGASRRLQRTTGPLLELCRTMPPPAIVPLAALLIGLGRAMGVAVVVFAAIWPIVLNTAAAVRSVHPVLLDAARTLQLSPIRRAQKVLAPALVPGMLVGVRVAAPICVIVTLLVEMLTGGTGAGALLLQAQRNFVASQVFGLLVVVGVFGFAVNASVGYVERRILRAWPPRTTSV